MTESVRNGFLSRVPILSVYDFRLFLSFYSQRKYTRWGGSTARSSERASLLPESIRCWQFTNSAGCFQESREKETKRVRESETERERKCVCFGFQRWSGLQFNSAGLHIVSGSNLPLGKIPSTFLGTSSRHKIPVNVKEMFKPHVYPPHLCVSTKYKKETQICCYIHHIRLTV